MPSTFKQKDEEQARALRRYTYSIEGYFGGKWVGLVFDAKGYCQGWMGRQREAPGPRLAYRLVRSDGKVLDEAPAVDRVSIGLVAGFPTAEQYEQAGIVALERARLIREREAERKSRRRRQP